jgi:hypothetical protein
MEDLTETSQPTTPTTFDSTALAEKLATTITAQITETFGADNLLRQPLPDDSHVPVPKEIHDHLADFGARHERLLADPRHSNASARYPGASPAAVDGPEAGAGRAGGLPRGGHAARGMDLLDDHDGPSKPNLLVDGKSGKNHPELCLETTAQ